MGRGVSLSRLSRVFVYAFRGVFVRGCCRPLKHLAWILCPVCSKHQCFVLCCFSERSETFRTANLILTFVLSAKSGSGHSSTIAVDRSFNDEEEEAQLFELPRSHFFLEILPLAANEQHPKQNKKQPCRKLMTARHRSRMLFWIKSR